MEKTPNKTPVESLSSDEAKKRELPTTSPNMSCRIFIHELMRQNAMEKIGVFLDEAEQRDYATFDSEEDLLESTREYQDAVSETLSYDEKDALKNYTGYGYKYINQFARGIWNYDFLGERTPESISKAESETQMLTRAIDKAPAIGADILTARGTNLDSFHGYNVAELADLSSLKGQFFLETGFTSTAIVHEKGFAGRDLDDPTREKCNVEILYMIPGETDDAVALLTDEVSYSPNQTEYLLQKGTLSYIKEVRVDPEHNSAQLVMMVIPRSIYEQPDKSEV